MKMVAFADASQPIDSRQCCSVNDVLSWKVKKGSVPHLITSAWKKSNQTVKHILDGGILTVTEVLDKHIPQCEVLQKILKVKAVS